MDGLNKKLRLRPGDVVWIGKQPAQPEVGATLPSLVPLVNLSISP